MTKNLKKDRGALTRADQVRFEERLRALHARYVENLERLERDALGGVDVARESQGDQGLGTFDQDRDLSILEIEEEALHEILAALERINSGEFGRCEQCNSWIQPDRLEAIPYASECMECAK